MDKSFIMGWSKATRIMPIAGALMLSPIIAVSFTAIPLLGLGLLAPVVFMIWLQYMTIRGGKYIVTGNEIIVKMFWTKTRRFSIDKIQKIDYIDLGTDWGRCPPNTRLQLAVYFERKYVKSVEPFRFGPSDRDGFVEALLEHNPGIIVDKKKEVGSV
ncbi:MAG: hypothetical protein HFJ93_01540 [Muribaculaceae bacterium]|jgi:hypothetical protein|nr:hypothetical protein [Muribaculaceae bacterium]